MEHLVVIHTVRSPDQVVSVVLGIIVGHMYIAQPLCCMYIKKEFTRCPVDYGNLSLLREHTIITMYQPSLAAGAAGATQDTERATNTMLQLPVVVVVVVARLFTAAIQQPNNTHRIWGEIKAPWIGVNLQRSLTQRPGCRTDIYRVNIIYC